MSPLRIQWSGGSLAHDWIRAKPHCIARLAKKGIVRLSLRPSGSYLTGGDSQGRIWRDRSAVSFGLVHGVMGGAGGGGAT